MEIQPIALQFALPFWQYYALVALFAAERLAELALSRRNRQAMLSASHRLPPQERSYQVMVAVHLAWFFGLAAEPLLRGHTVVDNPPTSFAPALLCCLLFLAQALRWWMLRSLGRYWNTQIVVPQAAGGLSAHDLVVTSGPYRFIRHPNYAALIVEIAVLPLLGGAVLTALLGSALNGAVLLVRIRAEESLLLGNPQYASHFARLPRFVPRVFSRRAASSNDSFSLAA